MLAVIKRVQWKGIDIGYHDFFDWAKTKTRLKSGAELGAQCIPKKFPSSIDWTLKRIAKMHEIAGRTSKTMSWSDGGMTVMMTRTPNTQNTIWRIDREI